MLYGIHDARSLLKAKPEKVEAIARRRLRFIINEAHRKVPFYSNTFRSMGLRSDDVKDADELSKLPVLTKRDVLEQREQLLNEDFQPNYCFVRSTSGSTGEPVTYFFDPKAWYYLEGITLRGQLQGGLKLKDRVAVVGSPHAIARNIFYKTLSRLGRLKYLSVFDDVVANLSSLQNFGPNVLKTFPSFLKAAIESNVSFHCPLVFSMSEAIDQSLRKGVDIAFGARVIDLYGAVELTTIAWQCKESSLYHLDSDVVIVEAVKLDSDSPANPGEPARILVTGLVNRAMPLIRYELGDIAVLSDDECSCGVKLPLMTRIEGRCVDCIRLPSGQLLSPYVFTQWAREIVGIRQYQIVQEEENRILVKIVPGLSFNKNLLSKWVSNLAEIVGENVRVDAEVVDTILMEKPGKYKYIVSKVK